MKALLIVLGFLSALLIVIQMVMGVLMRNGQANRRCERPTSTREA